MAGQLVAGRVDGVGAAVAAAVDASGHLQVDVMSSTANSIISNVELTIGTTGIAVPAGTRLVYMTVPVFDASGNTTTSPGYSVKKDASGNRVWVNFALEDLINSTPMPLTSYGGSSRWGFQFPYQTVSQEILGVTADTTPMIRVTTTTAQTATITTTFVR